MSYIEKKEQAIYFNIKADGLFHHRAKDGAEGAHQVTVKLSDGTEKVIWEYPEKETVIGKISKVSFMEGDYGTQMRVTVVDKDPAELPIVISMPATSNFADNFMEKLPNVNLDEEVSIRPYSFDAENGLTRKGVSLIQNKEKIQSAYFDPETKKGKNGTPTPKKKNMSKDEWKLFFAERNLFFREEVKKLFPENREDEKEEEDF